jgi:hypothetical protein
MAITSLTPRTQEPHEHLHVAEIHPNFSAAHPKTAKYLNNELARARGGLSRYHNILDKTPMDKEREQKARERLQAVSMAVNSANEGNLTGVKDMLAGIDRHLYRKMEHEAILLGTFPTDGREFDKAWEKCREARETRETISAGDRINKPVVAPEIREAVLNALETIHYQNLNILHNEAINGQASDEGRAMSLRYEDSYHMYAFIVQPAVEEVAEATKAARRVN